MPDPQDATVEFPAARIQPYDAIELVNSQTGETIILDTTHCPFCDQTMAMADFFRHLEPCIAAHPDHPSCVAARLQAEAEEQPI